MSVSCYIELNITVLKNSFCFCANRNSSWLKTNEWLSIQLYFGQFDKKQESFYLVTIVTNRIRAGGSRNNLLWELRPNFAFFTFFSILINAFCFLENQLFFLWTFQTTRYFPVCNKILFASIRRERTFSLKVYTVFVLARIDPTVFFLGVSRTLRAVNL